MQFCRKRPTVTSNRTERGRNISLPFGYVPSTAFRSVPPENARMTGFGTFRDVSGRHVHTLVEAEFNNTENIA
uniref:Uncharacterized protein n=1 Tax=Romanomermis culicivorax TaxID=13658 RepID=A0A915KKS4_ROMCU